MGLLQMFLEYGMGKLRSNTIIPSLRPIVILHGINHSDILDGYEKAIFGIAVISVWCSKSNFGYRIKL